MGDRFEITRHMTSAEFDDALERTYLGQAHIAGTGPEGKTCRECRWFGLHDIMRKVSDKKTGAISWKTYKAPLHDAAGALRRLRCLRPILNKPKRRFPHTAEACRLFEASEHPHPERIAGKKQ